MCLAPCFDEQGGKEHQICSCILHLPLCQCYKISNYAAVSLNAAASIGVLKVEFREEWCVSWEA